MKTDDPRRVYGAGETPLAIAEIIIAEIDRLSIDFKSLSRGEDTLAQRRGFISRKR